MSAYATLLGQLTLTTSSSSGSGTGEAPRHHSDGAVATSSGMTAAGVAGAQSGVGSDAGDDAAPPVLPPAEHDVPPLLPPTPRLSASDTTVPTSPINVSSMTRASASAFAPRRATSDLGSSPRDSSPLAREIHRLGTVLDELRQLAADTNQLYVRAEDWYHNRQQLFDKCQ
jgi:hypothetical protein